MKSAKDKYLWMRNKNNQGYEMQIVEYKGNKDIIVEFQAPYKYKTHSRVDRFLSGEIQNPYAPSICNFGIVGTKYHTHTEGGKKYLREYLTWTNMIKRCYDEEHRYKNPAYYNCECCEEWRYYENFYEWLHAQENYDILNDINDIAIDKDILVKGNREYRPDRCCLVTKRINNLLLKSNSIRGDCPIGVFYHKRNNKYIAHCGGKNNNQYLGSYDTEEEAFSVYKNYKEALIKRIATDEYNKHYITKECYDALMTYQVEISD